eukprot:5087177-Pleurochrysis_carterae.AAC.2
MDQGVGTSPRQLREVNEGIVASESTLEASGGRKCSCAKGCKLGRWVAAGDGKRLLKSHTARHTHIPTL